MALSLLHFTTKIDILGVNPFVTPPDNVLNAIFEQAGRTKGHIPIKGKINGVDFQQTLVRYLGEWRLYINGMMAKNAQLKYKKSISEIVGTEVTIEISFDPKPPEFKMHPKLKEALEKDKTAQATYNDLTPGRQKEILRYLGFMKSEEALKLNIKRIIHHLKDEETDALYPLMHRKKK